MENATGLPTLQGELVVDMSRVAFCDSGGLSALIRAHLRAREAGAQLHLLRPTEPVAALLRRTGAARVLSSGELRPRTPIGKPVPSPADGATRRYWGRS